jgi:hypothetical protein
LLQGIGFLAMARSAEGAQVPEPAGTATFRDCHFVVRLVAKSIFRQRYRQNRAYQKAMSITLGSIPNPERQFNPKPKPNPNLNPNLPEVGFHGLHHHPWSCNCFAPIGCGAFLCAVAAAAASAEQALKRARQEALKALWRRERLQF